MIKKIVDYAPIFLAIPPCLVIFGYGKMVCVNDNGSLQRIKKSYEFSTKYN